MVLIHRGKQRMCVASLSLLFNVMFAHLFPHVRELWRFKPKPQLQPDTRCDLNAKTNHLLIANFINFISHKTMATAGVPQLCSSLCSVPWKQFELLCLLHAASPVLLVFCHFAAFFRHFFFAPCRKFSWRRFLNLLAFFMCFLSLSGQQTSKKVQCPQICPLICYCCKKRKKQPQP